MTAFWDVLDLVLLLVSVALLGLTVVLGVLLAVAKLRKRPSTGATDAHAGVQTGGPAATKTSVMVAGVTGLLLLALAGVVFRNAHPTLDFPKDQSDTLTAIATVSGDLITSVIAGTTLYAVILLQRSIREQTNGVEEQTKQLRATAIQSVGKEMLEIDRWMVDNIERGYGEALKRPAAEDSPLGAAVAEVYADLIAQVVGQRHFLDHYYSGWDNYFIDIIHKWPQLKKYMDANGHWYGETLDYLGISKETPSSPSSSQ